MNNVIISWKCSECCGRSKCLCVKRDTQFEVGGPFNDFVGESLKIQAFFSYFIFHRCDVSLKNCQDSLRGAELAKRH